MTLRLTETATCELIERVNALTIANARQEGDLRAAYDRIEELADDLQRPAQRDNWLRAELDRWRGYAGIATVAALTLGGLLVVRYLGGL